jgi:predicted chitinase
MFIQHMKNCLWLDKGELARIYPDSSYNKKETPNPEVLRERYRDVLNKLMRKYLITTPTRMAHFFGQGAVESYRLARMMEASPGKHFSASLQPETSGYYNNPDDHYFNQYDGRLGNDPKGSGDGIKFRGRGMKQLTARENYTKYWVYRNWIDGSKLKNWKDSHGKYPLINDPERISSDEYNCIDAGTWYWTAGASANRFTTINSVVDDNSITDLDEKIKKITFAINGGYNGLEERKKFTRHIFPIIVD